MFYLKLDIDQNPQILFAHTFITDNYGFSNRVDDCLELVYIQKGTWNIEIKGYASYEAKPGDMAVLPPRIPCSVSIGSQGAIHEHSCVSFLAGSAVDTLDDGMLQNYEYLLDTEKYSHLKNRFILVPFLIPNALRYESLITGIVSEISLMRPAYQLTALGQLILLLSRMTRESLENALSARAETEVAPINHVYCRKIVEYLERYYPQKVSIPQIANSIGLNPHYMCNMFKMTTGDTIVTFLNRIRTEKAKELLVKSDEKMAEVCGAVGFENEQYFSRVFRKHQGMSPGRFRVISLNNLNSRKYIVVTT